MKNTLRTISLVAAGLLGTVSMAQAQPAPEPAPAPAPPPPPAPGQPGTAPAPPPPVDFGVAPAALPPAPVGNTTPVPQVSWGATPGADTTTPQAPEEEKKQNPFYFTRVSWGNSASTYMFGVGGHDPIGNDGNQYLMNFTFNFRYYFVNQPLDKAYVNLNFGFETELTDSTNTTTTTAHEPQLNDTVLGLGYGHTVYKSADKQWQTTPLISAGATFATSKQSRDQGKYLSTSINASLIQALPLAGSKSDWFPDLLAFGSVGYSHLFSNGYSATNSNVESYFRQAPDGSAYRSDLLGLSSFAIDKARFNLTYYLTIYKDLSLGNTWEIQAPFKHSFPGTSISTPTGPVAVGSSNTGNLNPVTTFDVSLSYLLFNTARIDLGYQNVTPELLENKGERVSVFWSPAATFYGNVTLYVDSLIEKGTAPDPTQKRKGVAMNRFGVGF